MFEKSWVWIPALFVWKTENKWKRGWGWPIFLTKWVISYLCLLKKFMADEVLQELRKIDSKNNFHITYLLTIRYFLSLGIGYDCNFLLSRIILILMWALGTLNGHYQGQCYSIWMHNLILTLTAQSKVVWKSLNQERPFRCWQKFWLIHTKRSSLHHHHHHRWNRVLSN